MKRFWLFRSDIRELEYYHSYKDFETFEKKCHDFYLMMGVEFLKMNVFDEVTIWRLHPKVKQPHYIMEVNGKRFIQRWVDDFKHCVDYPRFNYGKPDVSFFRGGFKEYCDLVKEKGNSLGKKLYLGAGKRITPQYGGIYDKILVESEYELTRGRISFYKTCNPHIFKPLDLDKKYDICMMSNFTQAHMKGQEFVIDQISKSKYLQSLKFVHLGNNPHVGKKMCNHYKVNNIEFKGWVDRPTANKILNQSKFGLMSSTLQDGCPRVSTEMLCSGTPLLIRNTTRLLPYYKKYGVVEFGDNNLEERVKHAIYIHSTLYKELRNNLDRLSYKKICEKNINLW